MNAYSLDLRKTIVEAKGRGSPTAEVARIFGVGLSTVKCYAAAPARVVDDSCDDNPVWTTVNSGVHV